jgi:HAD superfamily hydrolase (TIGR01549 family)
MPKAILFDVGGTLIHLDRRFVIQRLKEHGFEVSEADFMRAHACGVTEISRIMRSDNPGTDSSRWKVYAACLLRELKVDEQKQEAVQRAIWAPQNGVQLWRHVEPDTADTLEHLKNAGFRLGIVSNSDGKVASYVEKAGLAGYFDVIVDSGVLGIEKPDPRIFIHACERMNVQPSDTIYVGDIYEIDVVGARTAGLEAMLLTPDATERDCTVITRLPELLDQLLE